MRRYILFVMTILAVCRVYADGGEGSNFDFTHHRASISGMLTSSDTWQLDMAYHYMFNRYVGIGGAVGVWKVYYEDGFASGNNWQIESDDNKPSNIYLRPSLMLKSPAVKIKSVDLGLFAEPGFMMNIPYQSVWIRQNTPDWPEYDIKRVSTGKGQWCALDLRAGVYANIGPCGFSAGYLMSGFDVYSQYRHLSYGGVSFSRFYPRKSFLQGAYLTLSYYF